MKITMWQMYWITRLDDIGTALAVIIALSGITAIFTLINACGFSDAEVWNPEKAVYFYRTVMFFMAILMFETLIPDSKSMAAILIVPKIVNNEQVQQMPSKIMDLATEWLEALKPKKP